MLGTNKVVVVVVGKEALKTSGLRDVIVKELMRLRQRFEGISEQRVQSVLSGTKLNQMVNAKFRNRAIGRPIRASAVQVSRELTNRRLSHDGPVGSPYGPASSSCINLNLRITVKTTTFMRDRQIFPRFLKFVFIFLTMPNFSETRACIAYAYGSNFICTFVRPSQVNKSRLSVLELRQVRSRREIKRRM